MSTLDGLTPLSRGTVEENSATSLRSSHRHSFCLLGSPDQLPLTMDCADHMGSLGSWDAAPLQWVWMHIYAV